MIDHSKIPDQNLTQSLLMEALYGAIKGLIRKVIEPNLKRELTPDDWKHIHIYQDRMSLEVIGILCWGSLKLGEIRYARQNPLGEAPFTINIEFKPFAPNVDNFIPFDESNG